MSDNTQLVQMIYQFLAYIRMRDGEGVPFNANLARLSTFSVSK